MNTYKYKLELEMSTSTSSYTNISSMLSSTIYDDKQIAEFIITLLTTLFKVDPRTTSIHISKRDETPETHQILLNHLKHLQIYFDLPTSYTKSPLFLLKTIRHILTYLNTTYHYNPPLELSHHRSEPYSRETHKKQCETWYELRLFPTIPLSDYSTHHLYPLH